MGSCLAYSLGTRFQARLTIVGASALVLPVVSKSHARRAQNCLNGYHMGSAEDPATT